MGMIDARAPVLRKEIRRDTFFGEGKMFMAVGDVFTPRDTGYRGAFLRTQSIVLVEGTCP
jgi:hypothetical protein